MINPFWKTIIATAAGAAAPVAFDAVKNCGSDPKMLATQSAAMAIMALAALFTASPSEQKPRPKPTEPPPPTDPGGN